eukprot:1186924-Prorocentrum_minimum.AAC.1
MLALPCGHAGRGGHACRSALAIDWDAVLQDASGILYFYRLGSEAREACYTQTDASPLAVDLERYDRGVDDKWIRVMIRP